MTLKMYTTQYLLVLVLKVQDTGNNRDLADASRLNWNSVIRLLECSRRLSPSEHSALQV